jgi:hypothetical protein
MGLVGLSRTSPLEPPRDVPADYVGVMRTFASFLISIIMLTACGGEGLSEEARGWCSSHQEEVALAHTSLGLGVPIPHVQPEGYLDSAKGKRSCTKAYDSR